MQGSLRLLSAGLTTMLLIPSDGFSAQPDETLVVAATMEQGVLIVRHYSPAADANGRSEQQAVRDDAVPPSQDASRGAESTENSVLVIRRKPVEARDEDRHDAVDPDDRAEQAAAFPVDAVPSNPAAWTSVRASQYDRTNRAWSFHTNPSWSYKPHSLSYHPKRYQGFQPRQSWKYKPVPRLKYRPKHD